MALDTSGLSTAVANFLSVQRSSTAQAAADFATLYDNYCADAEFGGSAPVLAGRKALFQSALAASLSSGVFATVCTALGNAVAAYWAGCPVAGPQTGTAACPGAAGIAAALAALAPKATLSVAASTLAGALDTATRTTVATVSPPPGTVLPIL